MPTTRVAEIDLVAFGDILLEKLGGRYLKRTKEDLLNYLRYKLINNEFLFIKTANAIGLCQLIRPSMRFNPDIEEIFVVCRGPEHLAECEEIYLEMLAWGKLQGATSFLLENLTDLDRPALKKLFGGISLQTIPYVRILK